MNVDSTIINDNFATLLVQSFFAKKNLTWIYFLVSLANCIVLFLRIVKLLNIWKVWYLALALPSVFTSCHLGMIEVALPTTLDHHHHCHPYWHCQYDLCFIRVRYDMLIKYKQSSTLSLIKNVMWTYSLWALYTLRLCAQTVFTPNRHVVYICQPSRRSEPFLALSKIFNPPSGHKTVSESIF